MRYIRLAATLLVAALALPAWAEKPHAAHAAVLPPPEASAAAPSWHDCFYLAWIRGVHVEQQELPDFMEQCLSSSVPFGNDYQRYVKETGH